jgi:hypothetical protein
MKYVKYILLSLMLVGILLSVGISFAQDAEDVEAADYLLNFGGRGGYAGSTEGIGGLAVNSDGNLLVADAYGHISEFNLYGELIEVYEADAEGEDFGDVLGMVMTPSGSFYLSTQNPPAINLYDADWKLAQTISLGDNILANSIAYDAANDLLWAILIDYGQKATPNIVAYSADGEVEKEFPININFPGQNHYKLGGIAVDPDGNIVHAYGGVSSSTGDLDIVSGAIQVYSPEGELLSQWDQTEYVEESSPQNDGSTKTSRYYDIPYGVTVDSTGRIYSYDVLWLPTDTPGGGPRVSGIFTLTAPNGTALRQFPVSQDDSPEMAKVALSPDEKLLYVATQNFVHIISLSAEAPYTTVQLAENGRLRAAPVDGAVVGSLEAGTVLIVTGQNEAGDWLQVRHDGAEAWVAAFLTEPVER